MPSPTVTSPQVAVNDIGSSEDFLAAIDKTIKYFNDGDIVEGTIVKVDRTRCSSTSATRPKA
ncbi:30S ribosomal protein S1 [Mycobacterium tuberculosis]|nr:30S ribosomal protein S1 [Mycobacterium tuberculosis]